MWHNRPRPKRSSKPQDVNVLAADIVAEATGDSEKNPAAVALGRLGGRERLRDYEVVSLLRYD